MIILLCVMLVSIAYGYALGFSKGMKHATDLAVPRTVLNTLKTLGAEFEKIGQKNVFDTISKKFFNMEKLTKDGSWNESQDI